MGASTLHEEGLHGLIYQNNNLTNKDLYDNSW